MRSKLPRRCQPAPAASPGPGAEPVVLPRPFAAALRKASRAAALARGGEAFAAAAALLLAGLLLLCLLDWLVRTPQPLRLLFFAAQMGVCAALLAAALDRLSRGRPSDREAAFLLQRRYPQLRSAPISAVEIARGHGGSIRGAPALAGGLLDSVSEQVRGLDASDVASTDALKKLAAVALAAAVANAAWIGFFWPSSGVWVARWAGRSLPPPTYTLVESVTGDRTSRRGEDVALEARAVGVVPQSAWVELEFEDGSASRIPAPPLGEGGAPGSFRAVVRSAQSSFRYRFRIHDGTGATHEVRVLLPPSLADCSFTENFPAYTGLEPAERTVGGLDFLEGSKVRVAMRGTQPAASVELHLAGAGQMIPMTVSPEDPSAATAEFVVPENLEGIRFAIVNTGGVASADEALFRASARKDEPPSLDLLAPGSGIESVTPEAALPLAYACGDDFGVRGVELLYAVGDAGELEPPPPEKFTALPLPLPAGETGRFTWPIRSSGARPGQRLFFFLRATDNREPEAGATSLPTLSLAVITPEEKQVETLRRLREAAGEIRGLGERQLRVRDALDAGKEAGPRRFD